MTDDQDTQAAQAEYDADPGLQAVLAKAAESATVYRTRAHRVLSNGDQGS